MSQPFHSIQSADRVAAEAAHPWSGATQHDADVAQAKIGVLLVWISRMETGPTEVVAHGPFWWRRVFMAEMRGFRLVDESCADVCFPYFVALHNERFPGMSAKAVLDAWWSPSPITQAEIDAGWEIESDSCEEANRMFYGDKHPKEVLPMLCDPKANDAIVVR